MRGVAGRNGEGIQTRGLSPDPRCTGREKALKTEAMISDWHVPILSYDTGRMKGGLVESTGAPL